MTQTQYKFKSLKLIRSIYKPQKDLTFSVLYCIHFWEKRGLAPRDDHSAPLVLGFNERDIVVEDR